MDTGFLIGLIVLLGGGYLLIAKKKKQFFYFTHPTTKGKIKGNNSTMAYKSMAVFFDIFSARAFLIFNANQPKTPQKNTMNKVK